MKAFIKFLVLCIIFTFALTACNLPVAAPLSPDVNKAAGTIVALTMEAFTQSPSQGQSAGTPVPFASPLPGTLSPTEAILTINNPTNCRSGPGTSFQLITAFTPGTQVSIVGRDSADNYWQVMIPKTQDTCWASGEYATASGNFASLPDITPTAGSTGGGVPATPILAYRFDCSGGAQIVVTLTWTDKANDESGYRVYRNGIVLTELPANTTTYIDTAPYTLHTTISYGVEAFNAAGVSGRSTHSFVCPP